MVFSGDENRFKVGTDERMLGYTQYVGFVNAGIRVRWKKKSPLIETNTDNEGLGPGYFFFPKHLYPIVQNTLHVLKENFERNTREWK